MLEDRFIYYPTRYPGGDWTRENLPCRVEDRHIRTRDGETLHAWFAPADGAENHILFFHGNAGNVTHRTDFLHRLTRLPASVLLLDYRGYGRSSGRPTEKGLYEDGRAAYLHLVEDLGIPPHRIFLLGKSLGGAVAIEVATRFPVAGVIIQSTFTHTWDMARLMFWIPFPVRWICRNQFDSWTRVQTLTTPKLFIHGRGDRMVPYRLARTLFEAAAEPKRFFDLGNLDHNDSMEAGTGYDEALRAFLHSTGSSP